MQVIMLVVQILLAVALIGIILVQRNSQDGGGLMGSGGGTMGGLFTARGSANLLTRTTAILAALFIINSLALGIMASRGHANRSLIDQLATQQPAAPVSTPAAPEAPKASEAPQVPQVPMSK